VKRLGRADASNESTHALNTRCGSRLAAAVTDSKVELAPNVRVNESGNVVIFSTERTDEYFARIEVAGAVIARVRVVNAERGYDFERIIADIENINPESDIRLIAIDHIGDLSEKEIRSVAKVGDIITRLTTQAMRLRCCILMVTHTVKNANKATHPQQTFGGAVAWVRKWSDAFGICPIKHGVGVIEHVSPEL
jgi:AAA domain